VPPMELVLVTEPEQVGNLVIRRDVMEAHFPEFVKRVDALIKEADEFNREICALPSNQHVVHKKTPRSKRHNDPRESKIRKEVLETLGVYGLMRLRDIARLNTFGYPSVAAMVRDMKKSGEIISPERGFYRLPNKRGT
jgi:hypothetical protein